MLVERCDRDDDGGFDFTSSGAEGSFHLNPNPANNHIYLTINNLTSNINGTAYVFSSDGNLIIRKSIIQRVTKFDVSNISPGVYFLRFENELKIEYKKLIIQ